MAALEGEALLLGTWKNIKELEESLCLEELELIVTTSRKQRREEQTFLAALKGINLDNSADENKERVEALKKKADAIVRNKTQEEMEREEFAELGLDIETD